MNMEAAKEIRLVLASNDSGDESRVRLLLANTPWALVAVATVEDAIRTLHSVSLPIVLLDGNLEGRSWFETTRALLKARRRTCVIVLGDSGSLDSEEVSRQGGFDALARPIDKDELFATLLCAYSKARLHWLSVSRVHASPEPAVAP
jgi:DNA-binding response OmpR family regulator